jgi:hypothetical protein
LYAALRPRGTPSAVEDRRADDADTALQERAKTSMRTALTADPALRDKPGLWWNNVRSTYRSQLSDIREELIADVLAG